MQFPFFPTRWGHFQLTVCNSLCLPPHPSLFFVKYHPNIFLILALKHQILDKVCCFQIFQICNKIAVPSRAPDSPKIPYESADAHLSPSLNRDIKKILWTQIIPFNKLLSTSLFNFVLQHMVHIQYSIVMSLYIQKFLHGDSSHNHVDATVQAYRNK